jgi:hypothetical protein
MSALLLFVLFADVSVAAPPSSSANDVVSVLIQSGWVGLGTPNSVGVHLVRRPRGFTDGTRTVDAALVAALRARLLAPPVRTLPEALASRYRSFWTDDYPEVDVKLTLRSGRVIHANTRDQHDYMLPWTVDGKTTWDMRLSEAVAALLPEGAVNRAQLGREDEVRARTSRP